MSGLDSLSNEQLEIWLAQAMPQADHGRVVDRIALLKTADPHWLSIQVCTPQQGYSAGDVDRCFPLMSVIKPFLLLYLLEEFGEHKVFQWVGKSPSDRPFNSLEQLKADGGHPRNPMINSGAITLTSKLPGDGRDRCAAFCDWLNQQAGCQLQLDEAMLESVRAAGRETNQEIANLLSKTGYLKDTAAALDTYEQICCLSGTVADLAQLGRLLIRHAPIQPSHRRCVNALMLTCGLYEDSSHYAVRIGLPMKSGISGALLAIMPAAGTIACYSPPLDRAGNPVAALALVERLTNQLDLSLW